MKPSNAVALAFILCLSACSGRQQPITAPDSRSADEAAIRAADLEWSKAAGANDLDRTVSHVADDTVMLPPNAPAASGKAAVRGAWSAMLALPGLVLSWQPTKVEVARSGDLGYSQGAYAMSVNDAKGNPNADRGKYLSIWKKQTNGEWKCIVDTFNSDLPPAPAK